MCSTTNFHSVHFTNNVLPELLDTTVEDGDETLEACDAARYASIQGANERADTHIDELWDAIRDDKHWTQIQEINWENPIPAYSSNVVRMNMYGDDIPYTEDAIQIDGVNLTLPFDYDEGDVDQLKFLQFAIAFLTATRGNQLVSDNLRKNFQDVLPEGITAEQLMWLVGPNGHYEFVVDEDASCFCHGQVCRHDSCDEADCRINCGNCYEDINTSCGAILIGLLRLVPDEE